MSSLSIRARGWHNGTPRASGSGYGIAISQRDRDEHFAHSWVAVTLELEGGPTVKVSLSPAFWHTCTELRSAEIGRWLLELGLAPWPSGRPPALDMIPAAEASFAVRRSQER